MLIFCNVTGIIIINEIASADLLKADNGKQNDGGRYYIYAVFIGDRFHNFILSQVI